MVYHIIAKCEIIMKIEGNHNLFVACSAEGFFFLGGGMLGDYTTERGCKSVTMFCFDFVCKFRSPMGMH